MPKDFTTPKNLASADDSSLSSSAIPQTKSSVSANPSTSSSPIVKKSKPKVTNTAKAVQTISANVSKKADAESKGDDSNDPGTDESDDLFSQSGTLATDDIFGQIRFEVRIPRARIPMLIGSKGETKKKIETETGCKLQIDSQEGDVVVEGQDVVKGYVVRDIVKAIGRGFNPDVSLELLKADTAFELVEMAEFVKNKNAMERLKGRVIGQGGKTRETIEKLMDVHVSVQGKTIGIIGEIERVNTARQAIEMLLEGSQHTHVYRWLEGKRRSFTHTELSGGPDYAIKDEYKKYLKE